MGQQIYYRKGYRYQLYEDYSHQLSSAWLPYTKDMRFAETATQFFGIFPDGQLVIFRGYAWDGPSGPTVDTKDSLRGSLVHDCLYQAIRLQILPAECRRLADLEFYRILRADGMNKIRAGVWYEGVKRFAATCADPCNEREVLTAP